MLQGHPQSEARIEAETKERAILKGIEQARNDIRAIFNILADIDRQQLPESLLHHHIQPASLGGGTRFAINVRGEFLRDLDELQAQIQLLETDLTAIRRRFPFLIHRVYREQALAAQRRLHAHARRELKAAEAQGEVDAVTSAKLLREAEAAVREWATVLRMDPSPGNMKAALESAGDFLMLGGASGTRSYGEIFSLLRAASEKLLQRAYAAFQADRSPANGRALATAAARAQFLGVDSDLVNKYLEVLQPK